jgi:hypothetical protein
MVLKLSTKKVNETRMLMRYQDYQVMRT